MPVLDALDAVRAVWRTSRLTREELDAYQNRHVRRLIAHAYKTVPYYRTLFDEQGLKPDDIQTVEDLRYVPITSRSALQIVPISQIVAQGVDVSRLIERKTAGSSGKPLSVRRTWMEERVHGAFARRALRSYGLRATDRHCSVMLPREVHPRDGQFIQRLANFIGLARHHTVISCFQSPEDIVQALERSQAAAMSGIPMALARIAHTMNPQTLRSLDLRFVSSGGEVLTPLMRQQIEQGFGVPVYDTYASHEFYLMAWQCRETTALHVCDDGMVLEVLQGDRPVKEGESGEVVGTDLHSFAMPLIRYRLGDEVIKGGSACDCGQPFSTLRAIQGRMIDYFHLPDGRVVHPQALWSGQTRKTPWIREYQMTQERADHIVLRVVPFYPPSAEELGALQGPAVRFLGPLVNFTVELVPEIPLQPNGKFRVFQSCLNSSYEPVVSDGSGTR